MCMTRFLSSVDGPPPHIATALVRTLAVVELDEAS